MFDGRVKGDEPWPSAQQPERSNRPTEEGEVDDGYKWRVLFSVIFGTFMSILDNTVVNVALATLQKDFHASISHTQGVVTYYALSLGIVIPVAGFLADRFGIKRIYVISLVAFTTASALCGLAPSLNALIFFRILQGLGGGALLPLGTAMLFTAFPPNERGLALSVFGIPSLVAPALGPTLGGFLVQYVDWRFIFYINLPIGIVGALIASRNLRERKSATRARLRSAGIYPLDDRLRLAALWPLECRDGRLDEQHGPRIPQPRHRRVRRLRGRRVALAAPAPQCPLLSEADLLTGERRRLGVGGCALRRDLPPAALLPDTARADAVPDRACCSCRRRWRRSSRSSSAADSTTGSARATS